MMKSLIDEKWKRISFYRNAFGKHYAISNMGRLVCYENKFNEGSLLRCSLQEGYPIWRYRRKKRNGEISYHAALIHRLVADYFLPKPQHRETVVIHSNYKKADNRYYNLQWVTPEESYIHQQGSPAVKRLKKLRRENPQLYNAKLTVAKVKQIKKLLLQNKPLKTIAAAYGISDMQVYRIKTGENWIYIK